MHVLEVLGSNNIDKSQFENQNEVVLYSQHRQMIKNKSKRHKPLITSVEMVLKIVKCI